MLSQISGGFFCLFVLPTSIFPIIVNMLCNHNPVMRKQELFSELLKKVSLVVCVHSAGSENDYSTQNTVYRAFRVGTLPEQRATGEMHMYGERFRRKCNEIHPLEHSLFLFVNQCALQ